MSTKVASHKTTSTSSRVKKAQVPTPVVESVPVVVETPVKPTVVKKAKEPVVVEVPSDATVAPVVVETPVKSTVVKKGKEPVVVEAHVDKKFTTSEDVIAVLNNAISKLKEESANAKGRKDKESSSNINDLVKSLNSIKKPIDKLARSKPPRKQINIDGNRNGFLKPVLISNDLAHFLKCETGSMKSRVEVTRAICEYIETNKLQNPKNRREINVDPTLKHLLAYDPSTETVPLTYYMIQSRIQRHFVKPVPVVEA